MANPQPSSTSYDLLLDRLEQNTSKTPNKTAITFLSNGPDGGKEERTLTYKQLLAEVQSVAAFLLEQKHILPGDCVVLVYPPSLDYMVAFLACIYAKVVAVPVFPPARKDTIAMFNSIVANCGAKVSLTNTAYNHRKKILNLQNISLKRGSPSWPKDLVWIITDQAGTFPSSSFKVKPARTDLAFLQFTSGSTSEPKGVMITHQNLAHNLTIITRELEAKNDTVVVSWLPQYHDMGLIGSFLGVLYCGGSGYYMSPLSFLQRPMMWIEAISKYRATHLQAPNFAFALTARKIDNSFQGDLSSVRHVINAAEPVTEQAILDFCKAFCKFDYNEKSMFPTYGLAEHTVFVCSGGSQRLSVDKQMLETEGKVVLVQDETAATATRLVGCGYPAHQAVDVKIVNRETCQQVGYNLVGEIWVNSESKAAGYYHRPEETKQDFLAEIQEDKSGALYLRTGDLGFLHKDELFICGRIKDLIIVGGRNYYPQDLEATAEAANMELIRPGCSAAFSIETSASAEQVAMVLELRQVPPKHSLGDVCEPLIESVRSAVSQEHSLSLSDIWLLEPKTVPKTTSGKIARSWCRKGYLANSLKVVYRKEFCNNRTLHSPLEIDADASTAKGSLSQEEIDSIRGMDKKDILNRLKTELERLGAAEEIATDVPIATILDSISISQFKGILEGRFAVKPLPDDYLFHESCNLNKLAEVVRLGYAPDGGDGVNGRPAAVVQPEGHGGLAHALGCPPGVVCAIL